MTKINIKLDKLQELYKNKEYKKLILICEQLSENNPDLLDDKKFKTIYNDSRKKLDQDSNNYKLNIFKLNKQIRLYKENLQYVHAVEEAFYWANKFFKNKEYMKTIVACKEISELNEHHFQAKRLLNKAKFYLKEEETKAKFGFSKQKKKAKTKKEKTVEKLDRMRLKLDSYLEIKNYKKALKTAYVIMKKFPEDFEIERIINNIRQKIEEEEYENKNLQDIEYSYFKTLFRNVFFLLKKIQLYFVNHKKTLLKQLAENKSDKLKRIALELLENKQENNALARKIQRTIIPQIDKYTLPGFDIWGDTIQAEDLGGDTFNFIHKDMENVIFYVGDASGHGIAASLFASQANMYLQEGLKRGMSLRECVIFMNKMLVNKKQSNKNFITMSLFNWNSRDKELTMVGAGHESLIVYRYEEKKLELIPSKGIAIGMIKDNVTLTYERNINLKDNDMLFLFSDGITESRLKDDPNTLFGIDNFNKLIVKYLKSSSVKDVYTKIMKEISEKCIQKDDMTLLILRRDESHDILYEEDLAGLKAVNVDMLRNLVKNNVVKSLKEIDFEEKLKTLIDEINNLFIKGEYNLIINKIKRIITEDKIYNKRIIKLLKKAKTMKIKSDVKDKLLEIQVIFDEGKGLFKSGYYEKAKFEFLKIFNLKSKYQKRTKRYIDKINDKLILGIKYEEKKFQKFIANINKYVDKVFNPLKKSDNIDFIVKISNLINSGVKVKESLMILKRQSKKESLKSLYNTMIKNLEKGFMLSFSMNSFPKVFTELQISLIKAGEESGNLGPILEDLAVQLIEQRELKRKIKGALIYPAFIVVFCIILVVGMMMTVVPQLAEAFIQAGVSLPLPTQILIMISDFIKNYFLYLVLGVIIVITGLIYYGKTILGRINYDKIKLKLPVLKPMVVKYNVYNFANALAMLLDSGILLIDALKITSDIVENVFYKREVTRIKNKVTIGNSLAKAMGIDAIQNIYIKENEYFPLEVSQMTEVGENTGQISKMLRIIGNNYQDEIKQFAKNFATIIEPFLIVFIGVVVGTIVLAIMWPLFEMGKVVQQG